MNSVIDSTSPTTGALRVAGGLGVVANIVNGGVVPSMHPIPTHPDHTLTQTI